MAIDKVLIFASSQTHSFLSECLGKKSLDPTFAENAQHARELIHSQPYDLIIWDTAFSDISPLKTAKEENPHTLIILLTDINLVPLALEGMRLGAFTYLFKPLTREIFETALEKAHEHAALIQENHFLRREISSLPETRKYKIIAESAVMKKILSDVEKIAQSSASVFISGESGAGKEVIAQAIHSMSQRASSPFIKVNCAAIPETLIESEFFGHEKGAFTGAINKRVGRFELADKGTLLLDEISEVPLTVQPKLLRAVQEQEFERVGSIKTQRVDVRLISTSNRNMKEAVEEKLFREDLYYRLNVVPIHLAPLRERQEDILPLASYFLERLCDENRKPRKTLSPGAQKKLLNHPWPGNIRELANAIERAVVMHNQTELSETDMLLEEQYCIKPITATPAITLEELEKRHILEMLATQGYNKGKTAELLGISVRTLRNKLNLYSSSR